MNHCNYCQTGAGREYLRPSLQCRVSLGITWADWLTADAEYCRLIRAAISLKIGSALQESLQIFDGIPVNRLHETNGLSRAEILFFSRNGEKRRKSAAGQVGSATNDIFIFWCCGWVKIPQRHRCKTICPRGERVITVRWNNMDGPWITGKTSNVN